jgi:WD40 repeat protein
MLAASWGAYTYSSFSRLLNVTGDKRIVQLRGHLSDTHGGTFSHDGRLIATMSLDGTARLWDGLTGAFVRALGNESVGLQLNALGLENLDQEMNCAFSPDDKLLATVSLDNLVRVWDIENGSVQAILRGHNGLIEHVEFSPDGTRLLTASHDKTARLWDLGSALTIFLPHENSPTFATFSRDGTRLVTGGSSNVAHVWDVATGAEIATLKSRGSPLQYAVLNPDGREAATASQDGSVLLWDADQGEQIGSIKDSRVAVAELEFGPKGLEVARVDGTVTMSGSPRTSAAVIEGGGYLRKAVFSPDGQFVLTAASDNVARIWRKDGTQVALLSGHTNRVTAAAFSPDGNLVATGSLDGTARLWSVTSGNQLTVLKGHNARITDVAFSNDGQSIVTASHDRTARTWRVSDGANLFVLKGHAGGVTNAAFSPNGSYITTASSQDRTVKLWDARSGREIVELAGKENRPASTSASFDSSGKHIAVVAGDRNVRLTRAFETMQDMIDYARKIVPRELTPCERRRFFLPVATGTDDCLE